VFVGKSLAVAAELVVLEVLLGVGVVVLYDAEPTGVGLLVATCLAATVAVAATGTLYGALVSGLRVRETLLPLLLVPVLAPVLIGATRAFEAALGGVPADGWPWCGLLAAFAVAYSVAGAFAYGTLLEGS
jgi:heme exporter protein B